VGSGRLAEQDDDRICAGRDEAAQTQDCLHQGIKAGCEHLSGVRYCAPSGAADAMATALLGEPDV
jgi:hypothetical protein